MKGAHVGPIALHDPVEEILSLCGEREGYLTAVTRIFAAIDEAPLHRPIDQERR